MIQTIKQAACGRWLDVLTAAGIPSDLLDGRPHPCPKRCLPESGGKDRFNATKTVAETGAVFCRRCFNKASAVRPGDGIATVAWFTDSTNGEAAKFIADYLGLSTAKPDGAKKRRSIIESVATDKRMPLEAFLLFAPEPATRGREERPVARVPVYNEAGEVHSHYDLAPRCKGWFKRGKGSSGIFFPGRVPNDGETWLLVEGVKDAAALIGLGFNAAGMPSSFLADKYARLFNGVDVVCVPDLDTPGQHGAKRTGGNLVGIAASVRIARLPGEVRASKGDDVRDVLRRADGESLVRDAIDNAAMWEPDANETKQDGRPEVMVTLTEGFVADQVVSHVGSLGWKTDWIPEPIRESVKLFVRGGVLVHTIEGEDPSNRGRLNIRPVPACITRERITQACQLMVEQASGEDVEIVPTRPPKWLIDAVHYRGYFAGKVKPLAGIIHSPTIRPDGSIVQCAGYDDATGLLYQPTANFPEVPDKPTRDQAAAAVDSLYAVVVDFPFVDAADRSAWLGLALSMIGRSCVAGCVPLFAVTANIRGSGKSLLTDAASIIAYGRPAARKTFTRDDDELRKVITSVAIEAIPSVLFDNLDVQLGGSALDAALTAQTWSDRVLGSSRTTGELPMQTVWSATGNNMAFGSDVGRRVLPIRLQSPLETPEERSGFAHADLLGWVASNRPRFAVEALTILRAYFVAGCPSVPGGEWGSFESWSALVRGAIVWAGGADPLPTRETAKESDDSRTLLGMLIAGILEADPDGTGLTTKQVERLTTHRPDETPVCPTLIEAVSLICGDRFNARRFGRRMRSYIGRNCDGQKIESEKGHGGVNRWTVQPVDNAFGGFGGFHHTQSSHSAVVCVPNSAGDTADTTHPETGQGKREPPNQPYPPVPLIHNNGQEVEL